MSFYSIAQESPGVQFDPENIGSVLQRGPIKNGQLVSLAATLQTESDLAHLDFDGTSTEALYINNLTALSELPSPRQCIEGLAKEIKGSAATEDDYRNGAQVHLDVLTGFMAMPVLANIFHYAKKTLQKAGDNGSAFYVSRRIVGGNLPLVGVHDFTTSGVDFVSGQITKIRTMKQNVDELFIAGTPKGLKDAESPLIVPGLAKLRSTGLDELAHAVELLRVTEFGSMLVHAAGLRGLVVQDHLHAYNGLPKREAYILARVHMAELNRRGTGLAGPMHGLLHNIEGRTPHDWQQIVLRAVYAHKSPHTLRSDLRNMASTGGVVAAKVVSKVLRISK